MRKKISYIYVLFIILFIGIIPIKAENNGIILSKNQTTIGVGYSETLKYSLAGGLNSSNIIWTSSNEKVATVQNGKVTAITEGLTIITASINGNKSTCKVTVSSNYVPVNGIILNKSSLNLLIETSETLIQTISPSNATNKDVTWTSSNPDIAIVEDGKVTAKKLGSTIITVSISGYRSTCKVNVVDNVPLTKINIDKSNVTIKENTTEILNIIYSPSNATNKKVTWKSSNTSVATVDSQGKITGIKPGSTTVTAVSNDGGYVSICKVTVEAISKKVTSIDIDKKELSISIGEKATIEATITPSYAENKNITWSSSNKNIAIVNNGEITALSPGTTEIKAISEDGNKEAICKVTVTSPPIESISFINEEQTVYIESETKLTTISEPKNSTIENPIWQSSDEQVATVENGIVNALSIGETTITISNQDKTITASIKINVVNKPKEKLNITVEGYNLNFNPEIKNYTLKIGSEEKLTIKTNVSENKVTISGNQKLKNGSIIKITINDEEDYTYIINIKKNENYTIYFIAIISLLLFINLVRLMIKNKKKS